MRLILFLIGFSLLGYAGFAGYRQMQAASLTHADGPMPDGPATAQLEQILGQSQASEESAPALVRGDPAAPLIVLQPKGSASGPRFIKVQSND